MQQPKNYAEDAWEKYNASDSGAVPEPPANISIPLLNSSKPPSSLLTSSQPTLPSCRKARPPRPPNAFMLFRSDLWAKEKQKDSPIGRVHRDFSRIAGHCWNNLGEEEKARYQKLAEQAKRVHALQHPGYRYSPTIYRERTMKKKSKRGNHEEEERCRKLASLVMDGVSHADLRAAMKKPAPRVSSQSQSPTPGPSISTSPRTSTSVEADPGAANISPLDPSSGTDKGKNLDNLFDLSIQPPEYALVDHQFESVPRGSANFWLWHDYNGLARDAEKLIIPAFCENIDVDSPADFTDPLVANVLPTPGMFDQHVDSFSHPFMEDIIFSIGPHEADLKQYLHLE